jgi:20S proteasome alpha/beta subunit
MTTIAVKDGIVAWDSRATKGGTIADDDCQKMIVVQGVRVWFCGSWADRDRLVEYLITSPPETSPIEGSAIVLHEGNLYTVGCDKRGMWKCPEPLNVPLAIGSGSDHALTAMDCGLSAADAVRMAIKRDINSGGRVRTYKLTGRK